MAQSHETGNPLVTANNLIADLLDAPLGPGWTVEGIAEQLLSAWWPKAQKECKSSSSARTLPRIVNATAYSGLSSRASPPSRQSRLARLPICTAATCPSSDQAPKGQCGFSASSRTDQEACASPCDGLAHRPRVLKQGQDNRLHLPTRLRRAIFPRRANHWWWYLSCRLLKIH